MWPKFVYKWNGRKQPLGLLGPRAGTAQDTGRLGKYYGKSVRKHKKNYKSR